MGQGFDHMYEHTKGPLKWMLEIEMSLNPTLERSQGPRGSD